MENINEQNLTDWRNGKEWNSFFSQYYPFLKNLALSYKLPSQDVDDVVQEVFLTMAKHFRDKKFDSSKGAFHSWVTTMAKWRMIDIIRRNQTKARLITSGDDVLMEMQPDEDCDPHDKHEREHRFQVVRDALSNLKTQRVNKEYEIFCDMYLRDMSKEELMAKYKTSASGVYLAKHRVMKKLKAEISRLSIH